MDHRLMGILDFLTGNPKIPPEGFVSRATFDRLNYRWKEAFGTTTEPFCNEMPVKTFIDQLIILMDATYSRIDAIEDQISRKFGD
jgi:hypothetical protein